MRPLRPWANPPDRLLRAVPDRHCPLFGILDHGLVPPEDDHCLVVLELFGPADVADMGDVRSAVPGADRQCTVLVLAGEGASHWPVGHD